MIPHVRTTRSLAKLERLLNWPFRRFIANSFRLSHDVALTLSWEERERVPSPHSRRRACPAPQDSARRRDSKSGTHHDFWRRWGHKNRPSVHRYFGLISSRGSMVLSLRVSCRQLTPSRAECHPFPPFSFPSCAFYLCFVWLAFLHFWLRFCIRPSVRSLVQLLSQEPLH